MSLLITIVAGDGIVLAADSALTEMKGESIQITLSQFRKIIPISFLNSGISFAGNLRIGPLGPPDNQIYISKWVSDFVRNSEAKSFSQFATELVETLNDEEEQMDQLRVFHLAGWVKALDSKGIEKLMPRFIEISNEKGKYEITPLLQDKIVQDIIKWGDGDNTLYPMQIGTAGIPRGYANWIINDGVRQHSEFVNGQVPYPDITAVAEYARYLITSIADLFQISRQPILVDKPVETMMIFPKPKSLVSIRY